MKKLYRDVHTFITQCYVDYPFTLWELGCGSARHMAVALQESRINHYVGYDLSPMALVHARSNLNVLDCPLNCITKICGTVLMKPKISLM